jgi:hypothetical protein
VTVIAYGGFLYMVGKVEQGRDYITSAFLGVLLLFGSYLILYTINPELAKLKCELKKIAPAVNLEALPTTQQAQEMTKQATEAVAPIFNPETQTLECPKGYNEQITEEGIKCNSPSSNIGQ